MSVRSVSKSDAGKTPESVAIPPERVPAWHAVTRGVALFFGLFLLLQVWAELQAQSLSTDWWWIDLRPISPFTARGLLALHGILLAIFAISGDEPKPLRFLNWTLTIGLFAFALWNTFRWYGELATGAIHTPVRVPCFLQTAAFLSVVMAGLARRRTDENEHGGALLVGLVTFDLCVVIFPIVQILCSGPLDDRGPFDALVVVVPAEAAGDESAVAECAGILKKSPKSPVCLIGAPGRIEAWTGLLENHSDLDAQQIAAIESAGDEGTALDTLAKRAKAASWDSLLLAGAPVELPRWRIRVERIPLAVTQTPLAAETPRDWGRIFAELPALWMTSLRPR